MIFLDFDGVICDSAKEAFRVALLASGKIPNVSDSSYDHIYEDYYQLRKKVTAAWTYYHVINILFENADPKLNWELTDEAASFEKRFFAARKNVQETQYKQWLKLHRFYPEVLDVLKKSSVKYMIITNKNKEAVTDLCSNIGLNPLNIISMTDFSAITLKIDVLNSFFDEGIPVRFIDDNYATVNESKEKSISTAIDIKQATWGYSTQHCESLKITIYDFNDWFNKGN